MLALELNDCDLLSQADGQALYHSPAFALLNSNPIQFGESARAGNWQHPQHSNSQYWRQLSTEPLPHHQNHARHTADIAFAHLKAIWEHHGCPEELVIAVPGSFSDQQLSLLLGLTNALPVKVRAIIDTAVAGCANYASGNELLHIDIQLHQTLVTRLRLGGQRLSKIDTELIPDLGLLHLHNAAARHIADWLIREHRFDPFHSAISQQQLFNQLPQWLEMLEHQPEVQTEIHTQSGPLPLSLRQADIRQQLHQTASALWTLLSRHPNSGLCFSHRSQLLHQLHDATESTLLPETAAIETLLAQAQCVDETDSTLHIESITVSTPVIGPTAQATHLLVNNRIHSLSQPLSINSKNNDLEATAGVLNSAQLVLAIKQGLLQVIQTDNSLQVELPDTLNPGEAVLINGISLPLIEVAND